MSNPVQPVIVVKKKGGHAGHHGGAWKVAYADFVTAMMAFFLVMWLVGQSKSVKAGIGGYFRDPVAFAEGGRGVLPGGETMNQPTTEAPAPADTSEEAERHRLEAAVEHIKEGLDAIPAFQNLRDQVEFSVTAEGLRIDLIERSESSFFDSGSAVMHGETEKILGVIAKELGALAHDVVMEGHTDSRPYAASDRYSNWELSTDRANAARRVMERDGLRSNQITAVRGLADRQLRIPDDPLDARNRRVSILVKSPLFKDGAAGKPEADTTAASAEHGQPASAPAEHAPAAVAAH
jgi:chemotaxis protein MotB